MTKPPIEPNRPRVGVSACLIGWEVRWGGGHKWNSAVAEEIGRFVEWVPVCPELEIGLGVPREAIELVGDLSAPELVGMTSGRKLTITMSEWGARRLEELAAFSLSGYVLKRGSPSCGVRDVPIYDRSAAGATIIGSGRGLFARLLIDRFPALPIIEEDQLAEPKAREEFLDAVRRYRPTC